MGVIKTALEIAMEKTGNVKSDKSSIEQFKAKQQGKKLANAFLADDLDLMEEIKKASAGGKDKKLQESLKRGVFEVLITQISLPSSEEDEKRLEKLGKGLAAIINKNEFSAMYKQLTKLFSQYIQEAAKYEQAVHQQYAPKLRKKEEELSRRLGREIRIDPFQDPEFVGFYNQHMNALKSNYNPVIDQAKEKTQQMFEAK